MKLFYWLTVNIIALIPFYRPITAQETQSDDRPLRRHQFPPPLTLVQPFAAVSKAMKTERNTIADQFL